METILLERLAEDSRIMLLTINRPKAMNALNKTVITEMHEAMDQLSAMDDIRAVIITGAGEKSFVAGADISELIELNVESSYEQSRFGQTLYQKIENLNKIVIAAIGGYALGGGCEMAMSCDIRIASANAKMGLPEVSLGTIPGYAGTQRLPRLVGYGIAKELVYTAKHITAQRAYEIGLVNQVVEKREDLIPTCVEMIQTMFKHSFSAQMIAKRSMNEGRDMELYNAIQHEAALYSTTYATKDLEIGVSAFLNKEKPQFT